MPMKVSSGSWCFGLNNKQAHAASRTNTMGFTDELHMLPPDR